MEPISYLNQYESILTLFISALNLFLIVYFYISSRRYNLDLSKYDKKSIQFRELLLEPNQDKIETFYDNLYKRINNELQIIRIEIENESEHIPKVKRLISGLNEQKSDLRKSLGDIIYAFDKEFGLKFYQTLEDLQDELIPKISEIENAKDTEPEDYEDLLRKYKILTFNLLHNYEPFDIEGKQKFNLDEPLFIVFLLLAALILILVFA